MAITLIVLGVVLLFWRYWRVRKCKRQVEPRDTNRPTLWDRLVNIMLLVAGAVLMLFGVAVAIGRPLSTLEDLTLYLVALSIALAYKKICSNH